MTVAGKGDDGEGRRPFATRTGAEPPTAPSSIREGLRGRVRIPSPTTRSPASRRPRSRRTWSDSTLWPRRRGRWQGGEGRRPGPRPRRGAPSPGRDRRRAAGSRRVLGRDGLRFEPTSRRRVPGYNESILRKTPEKRGFSGLGWLTEHPVIGPWGWTQRLQSHPMTTDEQAGKDALWELHEAGNGVKERRAELASLTHRCGAFSSAVTKKLGQLGREEGHPHPPSVAFKSFSDGLELPALPTEEELPRAIEAFDQARNRLHTAQLKAKALGIT